jgi:tRNA1Val (adenine37-N6)-methyltransferase
MEDRLTRDSFLGGRLSIDQPLQGYRAGVDPVLLAASVPAEPAQSVLELGCGAGVAILCLGARVPGLELHGVEVQPEYAQLARTNAARAGLPLIVHEADIRELPDALRHLTFDHVIANPPYFVQEGRTRATDAGRERAFGEIIPLVDWVDCAVRRLKPGGGLTMIQSAERLPELLVAIRDRLGAIDVLPIASREGRSASRVILHGRKGRRSPMRLLAPLVMHEGTQHMRDGESYTAELGAILRNGAALQRFARTRKNRNAVGPDPSPAM